MRLPRSKAARLFWRSALQRFEDAEILLANERLTGAVYLAGYAVECALKTLILEHTPESQHDDVLASFRGAVAHDYDWLHSEYRQRGGTLPNDIRRVLVRLNWWSTNLRYQPATIKRSDASEFVADAETFLTWTEGTF